MQKNVLKLIGVCLIATSTSLGAAVGDVVLAAAGGPVALVALLPALHALNYPPYIAKELFADLTQEKVAQTIKHAQSFLSTWNAVPGQESELYMLRVELNEGLSFQVEAFFKTLSKTNELIVSSAHRKSSGSYADGLTKLLPLYTNLEPWIWANERIRKFFEANLERLTLKALLSKILRGASREKEQIEQNKALNALKNGLDDLESPLKKRAKKRCFGD